MRVVQGEYLLIFIEQVAHDGNGKQYFLISFVF